MNNIKNIIFSVLNWIVLAFIVWLMIEAITSPMIRWHWGYYNMELLSTSGVILTYMIFKTYFNSINILIKLDERKGK